jgi:DNA-binding LacI/PurR family transcriptional regulator
MKRIRISSLDVAKRAGVSRTTVSFVLNNTPGKIISEETRQRVLKAAAELDYEPNEAARTLAMVKHQAIGLFICHTGYFFSDVFINQLIEGINPILNKHRLQLVLQSLRLDQSDYLQLAHQDNVDGIILLNPHENDRGLAQIKESDIPLVVVGNLSDQSICQVDIDNREAAEEAVQYLIDLGHRDIGMILHAPVIYYAAVERFNGYRRSLRKNGLPFRDAYVKYGDFSEASGYAAMQALLSLPDRPTAVFAGNDVIAYGAMKAIKDAGFIIPDDISLIGFDDDFLSRFLNPPLTTVSLPAATLGASAASLVIQQLHNMPPEQYRFILSTFLAKRQSCQRI